jgi:hypothetical protein
MSNLTSFRINTSKNLCTFCISLISGHLKSLTISTSVNFDAKPPRINTSTKHGGGGQNVVEKRHPSLRPTFARIRPRMRVLSNSAPGGRVEGPAHPTKDARPEQVRLWRPSRRARPRTSPWPCEPLRPRATHGITAATFNLSRKNNESHSERPAGSEESLFHGLCLCRRHRRRLAFVAFEVALARRATHGITAATFNLSRKNNESHSERPAGSEESLFHGLCCRRGRRRAFVAFEVALARRTTHGITAATFNLSRKNNESHSERPAGSEESLFHGLCLCLCRRRRRRLVPARFTPRRSTPALSAAR